MRPEVRAIYDRRMAEINVKSLKIVVTGDSGAGKSCLITSFLKNSFNGEPERKVLDVVVLKKQVMRK